MQAVLSRMNANGKKFSERLTKPLAFGPPNGFLYRVDTNNICKLSQIQTVQAEIFIESIRSATINFV
jgi:hypothetical protein